jgi:hypothetical protein
MAKANSELATQRVIKVYEGKRMPWAEMPDERGRSEYLTNLTGVNDE